MFDYYQTIRKKRRRRICGVLLQGPRIPTDERTKAAQSKPAVASAFLQRGIKKSHCDYNLYNSLNLNALPRI
jgi:hypothetical protein